MRKIGIRALAAAALVLGWSVSAAAQEAPAVDTVRVGSGSVRGAVLEAGTYTLANYLRDDGDDTRISTTTQTVEGDSVGGVEVWVISTEHVSDDTTRSRITVRADDYSLVHHRVKGARDSTAVSANSEYLTGWVVLPDQPIALLDRVLEHPVFPVEGQIPWLFPLLPFAEGYSATVPHFNQWRGETSWKTIRVLGRETLEVAGTDFETWKIDGGELFSGYTVTYWVDRATRRIVRGVASGSGDGPVYWSELVD
ncbi:MAG: hypothetical protein OEM96_03920 [Gemmatimonadota bacterium]|nr:hypothetical protein [Gemmatimonadota bacterium]